MWFKNLQVYRFTKPFKTSAESLAEKLQAQAFEPCSTQEPVRSGWVPPLGRQATDFVHAVNGHIMICSKKQEKLLPAGVINEELEERVAELELAQDRKISRKERKDLKEEITFSFLPRAFVRSSLQFAYISIPDQLLIVNSSSPKKADDLLADLRNAIGSLPVVPLSCNDAPLAVMTQWVNSGRTTDHFELGTECELCADSDVSRVVRCKNQDLSSKEITNHLKTGMHVSKLALAWNDRIECILDEKLTIKRVRFTDIVQEKAADQSDDAAGQFDVDFSIMTLELKEFIAALVNAMGGEQAHENSATDKAPAKESQREDEVEPA